MNTAEDYMCRSKLAYQVGRYDDMAYNMKRFLETKNNLNHEEKLVFMLAYKSAVDKRRSAAKVIRTTSLADEDIRASYRLKIEAGIKLICGEVEELLEKRLRPSETSSAEDKVFYYKMKGDYLRYQSEIKDVRHDSLNEVVNKTDEAYKEGYAIAKENLESIDVFRLGVALNYSKFLYEVMHKWGEANELAKRAFFDALPGLDSLPEGGRFKESTSLMKIIRDNLTLWNKETNEIFPFPFLR